MRTGTGKTTTVLALARALYGPDLYRTRILELNASDDRGISVVREKIKSFAQGAVGTVKVEYVFFLDIFLTTCIISFLLLAVILALDSS